MSLNFKPGFEFTSLIQLFNKLNMDSKKKFLNNIFYKG